MPTNIRTTRPGSPPAGPFPEPMHVTIRSHLKAHHAWPHLSGLCCLLLFLIFLVSCTSAEQKEVESVIKRYNDHLAEGYRKQNMNVLRGVTTPDVALKHYHHMAALGEGKLRMESKLKSIDFTMVEIISASEAEVTTCEVWDYSHINMITGKKQYEEKDFVYTMAYRLRKDSGTWIVCQIDTLSGQTAR